MNRPEQAATVTPGQAAYEAFCRLFPYESWGPWDGLEYPDKDDRPGWQEIAHAAIEANEPVSGRVAELVTEGNELRAQAARQRRALKALDELFRIDSDPANPWNQRAMKIIARGLREDGPPAAVTAGTEHLAGQIRGLAIPDEEG